MVFGIDTEIGSGGGGTFDKREEVFVPSTPGQTAFTLAAAPANPSDSSLFVNTVKYLYGTDFSIAGTALTWLDNEFTLDTQDTLEVIYFV